MQLDKPVAIRLTSEHIDKLRELGGTKGMKFGTYVRCVLTEHTKNNSNNVSL